MSDPRVAINAIRIPLNTPSEVVDIVRQLETRLRALETELNRLTQGLYTKHDTQPYFLPPNGTVGYVLTYSTRTDNEGRVFPSATWSPP